MIDLATLDVRAVTGDRDAARLARWVERPTLLRPEDEVYDTILREEAAGRPITR